MLQGETLRLFVDYAKIRIAYGNKASNLTEIDEIHFKESENTNV